MVRLALKNVGLESTPADGKVRIEKEHVWLVRGIDLEQLKKLAKGSELQEQWTIMGEGFNLRIRATDNVKFIQTGKTWQHGVDGKTEVELPVNRAMFEVFKKASPSGMIKRRWFVDWQGVTFEVDIFYKEVDGELEIVPWCKIDLEVRDLDKPLPTLPFTAEEIIKDEPAHRTPEMEKVIPLIYQRYLSITKPVI